MPSCNGKIYGISMNIYCFLLSIYTGSGLDSYTKNYIFSGGDPTEHSTVTIVFRMYFFIFIHKSFIVRLSGEVSDSEACTIFESKYSTDWEHTQARRDFILSKTGSPRPAGTPIEIHSIIPPILFPSFCIASTKAIIWSDTLESAVRSLSVR